MKQSLLNTLNEHVNREFYSAYLYRSAASIMASENFPGISDWMMAQSEEETGHAEKIVKRFNALVPDLWQTECRILSGGNIQRLILGRETWRKPPVISASHPTEGLDARAIRHTWELFLELR